MPESQDASGRESQDAGGRGQYRPIYQPSRLCFCLGPSSHPFLNRLLGPPLRNPHPRMMRTVSWMEGGHKNLPSDHRVQMCRTILRSSRIMNPTCRYTNTTGTANHPSGWPTDQAAILCPVQRITCAASLYLSLLPPHASLSLSLSLSHTHTLCLSFSLPLFLSLPPSLSSLSLSPSPPQSEHQ
jgi:hypothetical protein